MHIQMFMPFSLAEGLVWHNRRDQVMPMQQNQKKYHCVMQVRWVEVIKVLSKYLSCNLLEMALETSINIIYTNVTWKMFRERPTWVPETKIWAKIPGTLDLSTNFSTTFQVTNANKTFNKVLLFFYHLICLCFLPVYSYISNWDNYNFNFLILHC